MSSGSHIEWTEATWNPVTGCTKVSPGCRNCYAERMAKRLKAMGNPRYAKGFELTIHDDDNVLEQPKRWKKPRRIFVNSMSDLFHEDVPDAFIDRVFDVCWATPRHQYQILTKRVERMAAYVSKRASQKSFGWTDIERKPMSPGDLFHFDDFSGRDMCGYLGCDDEVRCECTHEANEEPEEDSCAHWLCPLVSGADDRAALERIGVAEEYTYDSEGFAEDCEWVRLEGRPRHALCGNVQLGFSAEDQATFTKRAADMQSLRWEVGPYVKLFVSLEPLLGPIDCGEGLETYRFEHAGHDLDVPYLNWVIVGGESGPGARPMKAEWVREIRDRCVDRGVPFFFKQWGGTNKKKAGRELDGRTWDEMPHREIMP